MEVEGGRKNRGGFSLLTSPSGCGRDKCPVRAHYFSQLRPDQAEALFTYRGISKEGDHTSIKEEKGPIGAIQKLSVIASCWARASFSIERGN